MLSNYLGEFLALATIHFLAVVAPGPDFAVTIRQSVRFGRWVGICTALGIGAGISVHVLYTVLGVGALMHTTPWLLTVAKVLGGGYIVYLGVSLLRSKPKSTLDSEPAAAARGSAPAVPADPRGDACLQHRLQGDGRVRGRRHHRHAGPPGARGGRARHHHLL